MAIPADNTSMAVFCDFENVALGVRDAKYEKFDIKLVLERLLLKGSIVVKKAYCDWERYKGFKSTMHEANFELIEIPHLRMSGKNSADIRLVVDALDLCYTKAHVNTFVIISGDSDFSPLVSKLRENAKQVIGVGVKQSTSDLLTANCDEFIFYDDLVRETRRQHARRDARPEQDSAPAERRNDDDKRRESHDQRRAQAIELVLETLEALIDERGDSGKIWASVLKQAIKRRKPDFSESYYGFRSFGSLIEEAQKRGLLEFGRDDKNGAYVMRRHILPAATADQDNPGKGTGSVAAAPETGAHELAMSTAEALTLATREDRPQQETPLAPPPLPSSDTDAATVLTATNGTHANAATSSGVAADGTGSKAQRKPARQRAKERKSARRPDPAENTELVSGEMSARDPASLVAPPTAIPVVVASADTGQPRARTRSKTKPPSTREHEMASPAETLTEQALPAPSLPDDVAPPTAPARRRRTGKAAARTATPQETS